MMTPRPKVGEHPLTQPRVSICDAQILWSGPGMNDSWKGLHGSEEACLWVQTARLPACSLWSLCSFFNLPASHILPKRPGLPFPALSVGFPIFIKAYLPAAFFLTQMLLAKSRCLGGKLRCNVWLGEGDPIHHLASHNSAEARLALPCTRGPPTHGWLVPEVILAGKASGVLHPMVQVRSLW